MILCLPSSAEFGFLGFQALGSTLLYPFGVVRVLIQCGYEPLPPKRVTPWFGKPVNQLPSAWTYAKYLYNRHGFNGIYCGYFYCTLETFLYSIVRNVVLRSLEQETVGTCLSPLGFLTSGYEKTKTSLAPVSPTNSPHNQHSHQNPNAGKSPFTSSAWTTFFHPLKMELFAGCVAVLFSHPFAVLGVRQVGQLVGGESSYDGFIQPYLSTLQDSSSGFLSGLAPALVGEIVKVFLLLLLKKSAEYWLPLDEAGSEQSLICKDEFIDDDEDDYNFNSDKKLVHQAVQLLATPFVYPFSLIKTKMIVNHCGLHCGSTAFSPYYSNWISCLGDLYRRGGWSSQGLMIGSGLLRRHVPYPGFA